MFTSGVITGNTGGGLTMRVALGLVVDTGDFPVEFENSLFTNHMYHIIPYMEKVWRDKILVKRLM